ncbi:hypothetical protein [Novipirellula artificiosorum]|uniref:Uncharacterized protein n=1 Tax=Novipirellula artificiosorum TaxID=2528016 RepID=A0A5C6D968_9BACT|nr:hypothetical protein [Novipirellula artificiosorum]TWU31399.1 hypothetical protein Poly41_62680 [Novipirellula artificiosorum]
MNRHKNSSRDGLLERATEALRQTPISANAPADLVSSVVLRLDSEEAAADMVEPQSLFERIQAMQPLTKFVLVASLFLVFCGLFSLLSPRSLAYALEEVAAAIVLKMENAPEDRPVNGSFELLRQRVRNAQDDPGKGSLALGEKRVALSRRKREA